VEEASEFYAGDVATRVRDMEEKQQMLRDRLLLVGQTLVDHRESSFKEVLELKKNTHHMREELERIKSLIERISEQLSSTARKEEVLILQRQLDLLRNGTD